MKNTTAQNSNKLTEKEEAAINRSFRNNIIKMARSGKPCYADVIDNLLVGTPNYLGLASFWSHEYKHSLREFTCAQRCKVHNAFIKAGLALDGVSDKHYAIICKFNKNICQV